MPFVPPEPSFTVPPSPGVPAVPPSPEAPASPPNDGSPPPSLDEPPVAPCDEPPVGPCDEPPTASDELVEDVSKASAAEKAEAEAKVESRRRRTGFMIDHTVHEPAPETQSFEKSGVGPEGSALTRIAGRMSVDRDGGMTEKDAAEVRRSKKETSPSCDPCVVLVSCPGLPFRFSPSRGGVWSSRLAAARAKVELSEGREARDRWGETAMTR